LASNRERHGGIEPLNGSQKTRMILKETIGDVVNCDSKILRHLENDLRLLLLLHQLRDVEISSSDFDTLVR
jgi:hypothetical protein